MAWGDIPAVKEFIQAAPHYAVLVLMVWWFLRGLTRSLDKANTSLVTVAKQSATAIGQNTEMLRTLSQDIRGLNGRTDAVRQPPRRPVNLPTQGKGSATS